MPSQIFTYNPKQGSPVWGDIPILDWESIEIAPSADFTSTDVSSDGFSNVSMSPDTTCVITITLKALSPTNIHFGALIDDMQFGSGELPISSFLFREPSGILPVACKGVYPQAGPSMTAGMSVEGVTKVWVFRGSEMRWDYRGTGLSASVIAEYDDDTEGFLNVFTQLRAEL